MKKREKKVLWRSAVLPVAALLIAAIIGGSAIAEFTLSHRAKRVIAADGSGEMLYSSNYMRQGSITIGDTGTIIQYYYATTGADADALNIPITVCNFARGNKSFWYDRDIPYTLTAQVVELGVGNTVSAVIDAPAGVAIGYGSPDAAKTSLSGNNVAYTHTGEQLSSALADTHTFYLNYPAALRSRTNCYVLLTATPSGSNLTGLNTISALLGVRQQQSSINRNWTRDRLDDVNQPVSEYSGFRWQLHGSGKGTVTLTWDQTMLEISRVFWESVTNAAYTNSGSLEFHVDSSSINSYDIQFYRTGAEISDWSETNVKLNYVEDAPAPSGGEGE